MKKYLILLLFVPVVSCSKNVGATENTCNRIIEVLANHPYGGGYLTTALIEYDDRGRVKSVKGEGSNQSTYNYFKDSIQLLATDFNGMDISETYYLDSKQRIVNTKFFNYNYTYNDDGYLISYKAPYGINPCQVLGFIQYNLRYENGNLVELSTPDQTVSKQKVTFEYYDQPNQDVMGYNSPLYLGRVIYDRPTFFLIRNNFFGKQPKNLLKSLDFHDGFGPATISYQYDSSKRIIYSDDAYEFKYQCP